MALTGARSASASHRQLPGIHAPEPRTGSQLTPPGLCKPLLKTADEDSLAAGSTAGAVRKRVLPPFPSDPQTSPRVSFFSVRLMSRTAGPHMCGPGGAS
jgi:hypothetical protein